IMAGGKKQSAKLFLLACLVELTLGWRQNQDTEFTFLLPAGSTECFYQTTVKNWSIGVEYQVIAGAGLDVGFTLISPSGYRLASDFRRSDGTHTVHPTEDGDYRLCFDNSFSKRSEKMVFFEVIIDSGNDGGHEEWADVATPESMVDYKLEDIRVRTTGRTGFHRHLERSRQALVMLRAFETRDRYLLEDNLWRVSFWSCINLLVMLAVAATQIYTLRRLFDDKKRVCT
uniref:Transmembrane p24 trafficking protein 1a n=1 Tax=Myripristis murdjan TaxID=586833 RepID=A0A667XVR8_9TELE